MDRAEYEQKLKELEQKNKEMENEIKILKQEKIEDELPTPPHPRWKPRNDDIYYAVINTGFVTQHIWSKENFDYERYDIGNVFQSPKEAEFAIERLKVLSEMREWSGEWDDKWKMFYDGCQIEAIPDYGKCATYGELRFATKEDAQNCIKSVGEDRIKKYYFRIPNNEEGEKTDDRE